MHLIQNAPFRDPQKLAGSQCCLAIANKLPTIHPFPRLQSPANIRVHCVSLETVKIDRHH